MVLLQMIIPAVSTNHVAKGTFSPNYETAQGEEQPQADL